MEVTRDSKRYFNQKEKKRKQEKKERKKNEKEKKRRVYMGIETIALRFPSSSINVNPHLSFLPFPALIRNV